jgi:heat-inducible transcriptional repressor
MASKITLNSRQQEVLRATIRRYIATAEPVGSEVLVREYNMSVSSATIRNAMGMLERHGFLYQPHTSSGRIPSDSGYRVYVDHLMPTMLEPATTVSAAFSRQLNWGSWSVEAILKGAAQILSTLSGYITLVTLPTKGCLEVRHIQLVQIDPQQLMLILVADNYETHSFVVKLPIGEESLAAELLDRELQILSNFLNEALKGRSLMDLEGLDWSELGREFERYSDWFTTVVVDLSQRFAPPPSQMLISGVAEVLCQPEFAELSYLQNLLHLLEGEQDQVLPLLSNSLTTAGRRVTVRIGAENPLEPMRACSLISSTYCRGAQSGSANYAQSVGSIGVLGPTRMDYETAIALVEATADYLSELIN